jgi:CTP:molybdopterin cytidylyltransferase MocA
MRFCFVSTSRGSHFMTELLNAIAAATTAVGHEVEFAFDEFPALREECVYVVIPHEFQAWGSPSGFPDTEQRAHTIALCTENPGTSWFEQTYELVPQFAAAVSINRSSAAELERRGIRCEHLQLGYSPLWDTWRREEGTARSIDLLYLGAADPRRNPLLGSFGRDLSERQCQLLVPPLEPRTRARPDFLTGAEKYTRLRSARLLLNLHRTTSSALEWMRFLEAIANGCVVVSEPCRDGEPLIAEEHYIAAPVDQITKAVNDLLDEPARLLDIRQHAYDFVRDQLPMELAVAPLVELGAELPLPPAATNARPASRSQPEPPLTTAPAIDETIGSVQPGDELPVAQRPGSETNARRARPRALADQVWSFAEKLLVGRHNALRPHDQSASFAAARPRVSVILVGSHDDETARSLRSVAASHYDAIEVLVTGDASIYRSASAVRGSINEHSALPASLVRRPLQGLARSRNALVEYARGEYLFMLDSTGSIFPSTLQRLVAALDESPQAFFAYPMVGVLDGDRPVELLSSLPWEPERLKRGNWIDSLALIRRQRLLELGSYTTDPRLAGWEDFDLWCKCAQAGGRGVHVPQVLACHRRLPRCDGPSAENPTDIRWTLMRERFPQLLDPAEDA